jgi:predicted signal transduction protein with EAL and GGDEF domain
MVALRELGVRLAIDDFGTGYSSLSYLRRFPMDVLKIDKSFVDHIAEAGRDSALVEAMVSMGSTLDLRVVAEGIEDSEQLEALRGLNCALGQGYLFARPLPPGEIEAFVAALPAPVIYWPESAAHDLPPQATRRRRSSRRRRAPGPPRAPARRARGTGARCRGPGGRGPRRRRGG